MRLVEGQKFRTSKGLFIVTALWFQCGMVVEYEVKSLRTMQINIIPHWQFDKFEVEYIGN